MAALPDNAVHPATLAEWRAWLAANHLRDGGVWLVIWKKASGKQVFTFDDAIEEALCFGWIDSRPGKLDAGRTMLWFAPRKPGSGWSRINKERVAKVSAEGRMTAAGQAVIDASKADGSWAMLDAVENLEIPEDLAAAFDRHPPSRAHFEAFPRSAKRGILEWIVQAKRPETRAGRIEETARLAKENIRANQWPRR